MNWQENRERMERTLVVLLGLLQQYMSLISACVAAVPSLALDDVDRVWMSVTEILPLCDQRSFAAREIQSLAREGSLWKEMKRRETWGHRDTFKNDFRMSRETFKKLLQTLEPHVSVEQPYPGFIERTA